MDYFRIPPHAMSALLKHLGDTATAVVAQVHSHPRAAFHSRADDKWAIVRHLGALSLVIPHFARGISVENFLTRAAAFVLSEENTWEEVKSRDIERRIRIR